MVTDLPHLSRSSNEPLFEQIARHFTSQLIAFGTGEEIRFADRDAVEAIVDTVGEQGFPVRTMIKEVVNSALFKER